MCIEHGFTLFWFSTLLVAKGFLNLFGDWIERSIGFLASPSIIPSSILLPVQHYWSFLHWCNIMSLKESFNLKCLCVSNFLENFTTIVVFLAPPASGIECNWANTGLSNFCKQSPIIIYYMENHYFAICNIPFHLLLLLRAIRNTLIICSSILCD